MPGPSGVTVGTAGARVAVDGAGEEVTLLVGMGSPVTTRPSFPVQPQSSAASSASAETGRRIRFIRFLSFPEGFGISMHVRGRNMNGKKFRERKRTPHSASRSAESPRPERRFAPILRRRVSCASPGKRRARLFSD